MCHSTVAWLTSSSVMPRNTPQRSNLRYHHTHTLLPVTIAHLARCRQTNQLLHPAYLLRVANMLVAACVLPLFTLKTELVSHENTMLLYKKHSKTQQSNKILHGCIIQHTC
jgi:hypothetical protein